MVGVIFITLMASTFTVLVSNWVPMLSFPSQSSQTILQSPIDKISTLNQPTSMMNCGELLFSPIQKKCVSKDVFDAEMNRLFAALGLDTKPYHRNQDNP